MEEKPYMANYNYALSYLKLKQKEEALEALKRALSQIPDDEKNENGAIYLSILVNLSLLALEDKDFVQVARYIEEGLAVKCNHADLLFVKVLLLMDFKRFDEMLEALILYLLALDDQNAGSFNYNFAGDGALNEVYTNLLPMACKYAFEYPRIMEIAQRLFQASQSDHIKRACDIMTKIENTRNEIEN